MADDIPLRTEEGAPVLVRRSARRRRTVAAFWEDGNAVVAIPASFSKAQEREWVRRMLAHTRHPAVICELRAGDVPAMAESVQAHQSEPFGGLPTLAYARVYERARAEGVHVGFREYLRIGLPVTVATLIWGSAWLWISNS